jgi:hypothetical protein
VPGRLASGVAELVLRLKLSEDLLYHHSEYTARIILNIWLLNQTRLETENRMNDRQEWFECDWIPHVCFLPSAHEVRIRAVCPEGEKSAKILKRIRKIFIELL